MCDNNDKASLETLIPMIGQLQDILSTLPKSCELDIPQIAVLGDQSVGKSSVLEAIVGKDFLPRGIGMVTRCPILLHLVYVPERDKRRSHLSEDDKKKDWATFKDDSGKNGNAFTDFVKVRQEIEKKMQNNCGNGISKTVINLTIFSSKVIELTLVDLPGLITSAADGHDKNEPKIIEELAMEYIKKENCIILHVTHATQELNTTKSIELIDKVDPKGTRTLCVLTKLDRILTDTTLTKKVLNGEVRNFKHGIIGVVNRAPKDIHDKSLEDCVEDEELFLGEHFSGIAPRNGIKYLRTKLNQLLTSHIEACLPKFREEFENEIARQEKTLKSFGSAITEENKRRIITDSINDFCSAYEVLLLGTASDVHGCSTGANIMKVFQNFRKKLDKIEPSNKIDKFDERLLHSIQNASKNVERFPDFETFIFNAYNVHLLERLKETKTCIAYLIEIQNSPLDHSSTQSLEELQKNYKIDDLKSEIKESLVKKGFTENEIKIAEMTKYLLQKYFDHVRNILKNIIPQAIVTSLILPAKNRFKNDFEVEKGADLDKYFVEDEIITQCRNQTKEMLEKLEISKSYLP